MRILGKICGCSRPITKLLAVQRCRWAEVRRPPDASEYKGGRMRPREIRGFSSQRGPALVMCKLTPLARGTDHSQPREK